MNLCAKKFISCIRKLRDVFLTDIFYYLCNTNKLFFFVKWFSAKQKELSMLILGCSLINIFTNKTNGKNYHITLTWFWEENYLTLSIWIKLLFNVLSFLQYALKYTCLLLSYSWCSLFKTAQPRQIIILGWVRNEAAIASDMLYTIHIVHVSNLKLTLQLWFSDVWN